MAAPQPPKGPFSAFESETFSKDVSIELDEDIGAASISPSGRDVVLANKRGLQLIDLDNPYSAPRQIVNKTDWDVADVQWSPFACRANWIASTCNQKAIIYNVAMTPATSRAPIQFTLHSHDRAITDINFSAHNPDVLATCAVDSFVMTWDLRAPERKTSVLGESPALSQLSQADRLQWPNDKTTKWTDRLKQADTVLHTWDFASLEPHKPIVQVGNFEAGASQVKWNRQNEFIIASSHDKYLQIWDTRRGAKPLTTIFAHSNKVCGIDWHRSNATTIITCSLDKSIKIWDDVGVVSDISKPTSVIRTQHPVRRARHTPFPNGILSMPQRGSTALSLFTHSAGSPAGQSNLASAAHHFQAHGEDSQILEFLWRSRGSADATVDDRDFQLVSLGTDRHLNLYTVSKDLLFNSVGFKKGGPVIEKPSDTRKDAPYVSYRDGPPKSTQPTGSLSVGPQQAKGVLRQLIEEAHRLDVPERPDAELDRTTMTATTIRQQILGKVTNTMKWIHGVKVGERHHDLGADIHSSSASKNLIAVEQQKDLKAEVSQVGQRFSKIKFEKTDFQGRSITVTFNGPWGDPDMSNDRKGDRKLVFLRLNVGFPEDYPNIIDTIPHPLHLEFQKTTAAIDEANLIKLQADLQAIADHYASSGREALEAVVSYALGERRLTDVLALNPEREHGVEWPGSESSTSDDDDDDTFEGIGQTILPPSHADANVPLPIQCTARFSATLSLVVSKPLVAPSREGLTDPLRLTRHPLQGQPRDEIFEAFGRLDPDHGYGSDSPTSSTASWELASSPSSSSSTDREAGAPLGGFQPPLAWQRGNVRLLTQQSHPSSVGAAKPRKEPSILTIYGPSFESLIPSRKDLAEEYRIFGDGPSVCMHNSGVARKFGLNDLADIWLLCKLILNNEVPLEILPQQHRREQVLVLARRALVRIKRKDSGLDLQFDEADTVTNPKLRGRIKWGQHSIVTWLIPALFDHFEKLADTQMLAMLSCIFCEPAAREGVTSAMAKMRQSKLPMSMEAPAFSLDYFPSADAAWSLFKPTISIPATPAYSRYATPVNEFGWHRFTKTLNTYGSHGSSSGQWGSDTIPSEPVTPYSTGNTPPNLSRAPTLRSLASNTPYSSSPEQTHVTKRSSTANFANAFATLSRPFSNAVSSSPPVKNRMEADLSTSAPTSGVTWGTTTFFSSGSQERTPAPPRSKHGKRASFGQADRVNIDYYSDSDSEYGDLGMLHDAASEYTAPLISGGDDGGTIKVTLKNQDKFDDEGCVSAPLLDLSKDWLYKAWREQYAEMLGCWGLVSKRAEVLKFNGLISYFPPDNSRRGSRAGSLNLALKTDSSSTPLSRTSTLAPPPMLQLHRTPTSSPRQFSFNPEASEFRPGDAFEPGMVGPLPDISVSSEQNLRLSVALPAPDSDTGIGSPFYDAAEGKAGLKSRPGLGSRNHSNVSKASARSMKKGLDRVYSCSICWIRISGRFFLCPSCGHVAHFECMDCDEGLGHGWEEGECVVGCGCGCGFEEEDYDNDVQKQGLDEKVDGPRTPYAHEGTWEKGQRTDAAESPVKKSVERNKGTRR